MANLSHSVSKRAYNSGNGSFSDKKTVYDDVFGGPPRLGVPTLAPRLEDYAEIFGGFHASRAVSSSIPLLDLLPSPIVDELTDFSVDVRSSNFDYSQVFGGFKALDFAVSFEELFSHQSKPTYDSSSHEAWTPAQSESLSDESDPSAYSERSQSLSNGGPYQSCDGIKQFNVSKDNKASQRSKEDMSIGMAHITQLHAIPGFTFVVNEIHPSQKTEYQDTSLLATDDLNANVDFGGGLREGKQFRKTMSHPSSSSFGIQTLGTELKPLRYGKTASCMNETFVTVSDISLRTHPSQLPPPLRPPPVLSVKDGDFERQKSKLTACKSFPLGETAADSSPPLFDVEVDGSSSAAVSAAAMKNAVEKAQAKLRSAKELMERKEGLQSRTKLGLKNDAKEKKEKERQAIDESNCCKDAKAHGTCQRDCSRMKTFGGEERQKVMKTTHIVSDSIEGEKHINMSKVSADKKHGKDRSSQESHKTEGAVAWRQGAQYYEVFETDKSRKIFKEATDGGVLEQNTHFREPGQEEKTTPVVQQLEEDNGKKREAREGREWDGNKGRSKETKEPSRQEKLEKKVKVNQEVSVHEENEKKPRMVQQKIPTEADISDCENLAEVQQKEHEVKVEKKLKEATERIENGKTDKDGHERVERERRLKETLEREGYEKRLKETIERAEIEKRLKEALTREEREKHQREEKENRQKEACDREENEKKLEEAREREENEKRLKEALEQEENKKRLKEAVEREEDEKWLKLAHERDENGKRRVEDLRMEENGEKQKEAHEREEIKERLNEACEGEEYEHRLTEAWEQDESKKRLQNSHGTEESEKRSKEAFKHKEIEKRPEDATDCQETQKGIEVAGYWEEWNGRSKEHEHGNDENGRKLNSDQGPYVNVEGETFKASDGAVEMVNFPLESQFISYNMAQDDSKHEKNQIKRKYATRSLHLHDSVMESVEPGIGSGQTHMDRNENASKIDSYIGKPNVFTYELGETEIDVKEVEVMFEKEETKAKFMSSQVVRELVENERKIEADQPSALEGKRNSQSTAQKISMSQNIERKGNNLNDILTPRESEKEDKIKGERELEKDRLRKIEEEREREREREKDRMAIDRATLEARERATLEARERAFAETRERAERAAVERTTAEARQRVMAEARERLEKASAEARDRSLAEKASMEARLRAERAAVERATAEARERAFQKAMNEKANFEARERVERSVVDKSSAPCNNGGIRQSSSFSDLQDVRCQGVGFSSGSIYSYSYSSSHGGVEGESAQRCKARLERHRRTAERAAKALAEKNMRDLLAQREQAERNRLAEALDAEVKRWSSGKEGNLRALLSTLQYILGPDSGWQPIPLTEVITSAAVKKAYRKATLSVHPDKLQQRGASIQQKYICEKVFDLLKEAWNKFNSEER